ncbi:SCF ubiquitin ligase complex subunit UFO1 NDAI_0K00240 [Naumovozyma dairenensis CBS 421]|uniref:F-box domain-containing protein n=1 Tax=Naumovozyma dairenensis (strain ATCC 10597 / BCRC 20456 / CBS 421 / NBRC 0211 / NRRL Y-12639) TaxID=1071378 RepID=G0WHF2_NAUDC|nr:hypothetical protein NDAI_0K00240 [Naumovozyma dairenensis CBS 421]CCD27213.1 hypothetical protein NDAI_0K00240 [Naumovozyma dairenensis CBS 421]
MITLQKLPPEILITIFSYLDEKDLILLQELSSYFNDLINDEELWKNLFKTRIHSTHFPSFSNSNKYSIEYVERIKGLNQWKHNRAIKTKYIVSPTPLINQQHQQQQDQIEKIYFDYPRCACYNDGVITLIQLQSRKNKQRKFTYIPCTTPQGCSTMNFNISAAVFGRFDGRVFGKLLSNKSYLTPITEFDSRHSTTVTAITNSSLSSSSTAGNSESNLNWCVSGSENGEIIWWCETKKMKFIKISNNTILSLALLKEWTISLDEEKIYIIKNMEEIHSLPLPITPTAGNKPLQVHFFKIDFGSKQLIIADLKTLYIISFDPNQNFGFTKSFTFEDTQTTISDIVIDEQTSIREQNLQLAGNDGCFISVLTSLNEIYIINIRIPGPTIKIQTILPFHDDIVYKCQITNLVLVVAFNGFLQIYDAINGAMIKSIQKTDQFPEFLNISQGRMIIGNGNTIHYLQFISDDLMNKKSKHHHGSSSSRSQRGNKWNETLHSGLEMYDEEKNLAAKKERQNAKLLALYGGDLNDMDDEEIQLKIALMESEEANSIRDNNILTTQASVHDGNEEEEEEEEDLQRAIEESRRLHESENSFANEDDEDFLRAIEQSRLIEQEDIESTNRIRTRRSPLSTHNHPNVSSQNNINDQTDTSPTDNITEDEQLQLAIALSLSEINE